MITRLRGFTLIELMIVVVIISILVGIGYPTYLDQVRKTRRTEGQTALLDLASRLERYYTDNNTYATATIGTAPSTDVLPTALTSSQWYNISITNLSATDYTLRASPLNDQANDTICGTLTYTQAGIKGHTGSGTLKDCW